MILRSLSAVLLGAALLASAPAWAETPMRTITMSGNGEVTAAPDRASFTTGVAAEARTAADALAENSANMRKVMAALKKLGVPDKAIRTSGFSLSPRYHEIERTDNNGRRSSERRISGYKVRNNVTVTIDDVKRIGAVIDALVRAGANQTGSLQFSLRNPKPLLAKARALAVEDAVAKAQIFAKAAGVALGPIQKIGEQNNGAPSFDTFKRAMPAAAPPPISAGEERVSASVTITWRIM